MCGSNGAVYVCLHVCVCVYVVPGVAVRVKGRGYHVITRLSLCDGTLERERRHPSTPTNNHNHTTPHTRAAHVLFTRRHVLCVPRI